MEGIMDYAKKFFKTFCIVLMVAVVIKQYMFCGAYIIGESMCPTLHPNDVILMSKLSISRKNLKRYDIVSIDGVEDGKIYVKRVIGLPGDIVEIANGKVYVNNEELEEKYLDNTEETHYFIDNYWEVDKDSIFVLGDNRGNSQDSRFFGVIKQKQVQGVGIFRYLPLNRKGKIE